MTAHTHTEFVEGCYRCDISRDEVSGSTLKGQTLLSGHTLRYEGQPFDSNGKKLYGGRDGRGKCSCGALSDVLDSNNKRKQWHREHKEAIRNEWS